MLVLNKITALFLLELKISLQTGGKRFLKARLDIKLDFYWPSVAVEQINSI